MGLKFQPHYAVKTHLRSETIYIGNCCRRLNWGDNHGIF